MGRLAVLCQIMVLVPLRLYLSSYLLNARLPLVKGLELLNEALFRIENPIALITLNDIILLYGRLPLVTRGLLYSPLIYLSRVGRSITAQVGLFLAAHG